MLSIIVKKELLENIKNYRLLVFLLVSLILIPLSIYVHYQNYQTQLQHYQEQQRLIQIEKSKNRYYDLTHLVAYREPKFLSVFANGLVGQLPASYVITEEGYSGSDYPSPQSTLIELIGGLDYLSVLQIVITLIAHLFAVDTIAGEKEQGTLRLSLMNGVSRNIILIGKLVGEYICLLAPFSIGFLAGFLALGTMDAQLYQYHYLFRLLLLYLFSILLLAIYVAMGAAISSLTSRVRTGFMIAVALWISLQIVVPRVATMIARVVGPVPSKVLESMEQEQIRKVVYEEEAEETTRESLRFWGRSLMANDILDKVKWEQWEKIQYPIRRKYENKLSTLLRAKYEEQEQRELHQESIASSIATVSPGFAFAALACDLAETGRLSARKFLADVRHFERAVQQEIYSVGFVQRLLVNGEMSVMKRSKRDQIKEVPRFAHHPPSIADVLSFNSGPILTLLAWLVGSIFVAYVAFRSYDVR